MEIMTEFAPTSPDYLPAAGHDYLLPFYDVMTRLMGVTKIHRELVQHAERAGFGAVMSSEHFHPWSERQGQSGFTLSWLGAAMQATTLPFGTLAVPGGWRFHPAIVAQAAATLAQMYPGRFWVSLGSGHLGQFDRSKCQGPLNGPEGHNALFTAEGQTEAQHRQNPFVNLQAAMPGYFTTMRRSQSGTGTTTSTSAIATPTTGPFRSLASIRIRFPSKSVPNSNFVSASRMPRVRA